MAQKDRINDLIVAKIISDYAQREIVDGLFLWIKEHGTPIADAYTTAYSVREISGQRIVV